MTASHPNTFRRLSLLGIAAAIVLSVSLSTRSATGAEAAPEAPPLAERAAVRAHQLGAPLGPALERFYAERARTAWLRPRSFWRGGAPTGRVDELIAALRGADRIGLEPSAYDADALEARVAKTYGDGEPTSDAAQALDLALSEAFLRLAHDASNGRVDPTRLAIAWHVEPSEPVLADWLETALRSGVGAALRDAEPPHPEYAALVEALERHRARGGDAAELAQLEANIERWRWVPREFGRRHLRVNIPEFALELHEGGARPSLAMRVIVGKEVEALQTPILSDEIEYLVVNPYWNVPQSILVDEILPAWEEDDEHLAKQGLEIVRTDAEDDAGEPLVVDPDSVDPDDLATEDSPYRVRQRPGPGNALGRIKFIFPNRLSIYLHGTPTEQLFERSERDLSHGCIRVERPIELAAKLLEGSDWDVARLEEAIASGERTQIALPERLPVYLLYWTAVPQPDGEVAFHRDLYGIDAQLQEVLRARRTPGRAADRRTADAAPDADERSSDDTDEGHAPRNAAALQDAP